MAVREPPRFDVAVELPATDLGVSRTPLWWHGVKWLQWALFLTAVAGDGSADVSWTAPASDGGSAVTGYTVTGSGGTSVSASGTSSEKTIQIMAPAAKPNPQGRSGRKTSTKKNAAGTSGQMRVA